MFVTYLAFKMHSALLHEKIPNDLKLLHQYLYYSSYSYNNINWYYDDSDDAATQFIETRTHERTKISNARVRACRQRSRVFGSCIHQRSPNRSKYRIDSPITIGCRYFIHAQRITARIRVICTHEQRSFECSRCASHKILYYAFEYAPLWYTYDSN